MPELRERSEYMEVVQFVRDNAMCCVRKTTAIPLSTRIARRVVERAVAIAFEVPLKELRATTRREARIAFARQVAMYLVHVAYGFTLTQVGTMFRRDRTTVAHACIIIEDRRDDLAFDVLLDDLETAVVCLTSALNSFKI